MAGGHIITDNYTNGRGETLGRKKEEWRGNVIGARRSVHSLVRSVLQFERCAKFRSEKSAEIQMSPHYVDLEQFRLQIYKI